MARASKVFEDEEQVKPKAEPKTSKHDVEVVKAFLKGVTSKLKKAKGEPPRADLIRRAMIRELGVYMTDGTIELAISKGMKK